MDRMGDGQATSHHTVIGTLMCSGDTRLGLMKFFSPEGMGQREGGIRAK